jgi:FkbM family methyltransferase
MLQEIIKWIRWKIKEHEDLNLGFKILGSDEKHSLIKEVFNKKYRKEMYKEWIEQPKEVLKTLGITISDRTSPEALTGAFSEIFIHGIYNVEGFKPKQDEIVVDIGAYYGDSALWYAKIFGAKVYAFEPLSSIYEILVENIKLNNLENKIIPYNYAIGNGKKENFSVMVDMLSKSNKGKIVETKKLDEFSFEGVHILKIDAEGFEFEILEGAKETIQKFKPRIILETHSRALKVKCVNYLSDLGYKLNVEGRIERHSLNPDFDFVQNLFLMPQSHSKTQPISHT